MRISDCIFGDAPCDTHCRRATCAVTVFGYCGAMTVALHPGHELHCPHCRRWHPITRSHDAGTDYTVQMMYFECPGLRYYAGQIGQSSRHETRLALRASPHEEPEAPEGR